MYMPWPKNIYWTKAISRQIYSNKQRAETIFATLLHYIISTNTLLAIDTIKRIRLPTKTQAQKDNNCHKPHKNPKSSVYRNLTISEYLKENI